METTEVFLVFILIALVVIIFPTFKGKGNESDITEEDIKSRSFRKIDGFVVYNINGIEYIECDNGSLIPLQYNKQENVYIETKEY